MKKLFITTFIFVFSFALFPSFSFAQGMMGSNMVGKVDTVTQNDNGHTASGEQEGKELLRKLQAQELNCEDLSDDDFHALGMYFMGLMVGDSHEAMDAMMERMMGEEGENQMHIAMGKRMSGCEPNAPMPQSMADGGMMQMMMGGGMMGGWSSPFSNDNSTNNMMNFGFMPFGSFGWIFMILWWVLIIAGIVALFKWLTSQSRNTHNHEKSALEVLKERYAKGQIDKKEFEDKKKDLL
ncbi:MAG: hypothetical protein COV07_03720 [Candidatus Vogelbacteria bacterium CG10_big_fil_rev_8_21_14_0_10_45_14]|uniref:SHOCT domain-containing protein n=1 Tax=Candidatus Vogelbacteria bacterium CG10_big_fil_rev_8_21_14_0_10_45_14 TaxID=1975042 RepID=A0A2H0RIX5_9BACT|nr:MAG: hypothetical protein COV07_03720 [Candidatus Vogelbacteria bacterium CG10_big_fil_rev_8_21_14_0_10_45_14]